MEGHYFSLMNCVKCKGKGSFLTRGIPRTVKTKRAGFPAPLPFLSATGLPSSPILDKAKHSDANKGSGFLGRSLAKLESELT